MFDIKQNLFTFIFCTRYNFIIPLADNFPDVFNTRNILYRLNANESVMDVLKYRTLYWSWN